MNPRGVNAQLSARHCRFRCGNACLAAELLQKLSSQRASNLNKARKGPAKTQTFGANQRRKLPNRFNPVKRDWLVGPRTNTVRQFSPLAARRPLDKAAGMAQARELAA
jgi:hypothetical protein